MSRQGSKLVRWYGPGQVHTSPGLGQVLHPEFALVHCVGCGGGNNWTSLPDYSSHATVWSKSFLVVLTAVSSQRLMSKVKEVDHSQMQLQVSIVDVR